MTDVEDQTAGSAPADAAAAEFEAARTDTDKTVADATAALLSKIDGLEAQVTSLTAARDDAIAAADKAVADATAALESKIANLDALTQDLQSQVTVVTAEREAAIAAAGKAERAATRATRGEKPARARKLDPADRGLQGAELDDALAGAVADEKTVEIVVCDGKREVTEVPSVIVQPGDFRLHTLGKMLRDPVKVAGPAQGKPGFRIAGYALLIDGKQVSYCSRSDAINVGAGQTVNLADDIYF